MISITAQEIDLLNRYFSTKTIFQVKLGCDEEAKEVLQASLTNTPIRHAILSLRALREDFETLGNSPATVTQQTPSYHYGLQQYNMALRGVASNLTSPDFNGLKLALLCCQVFISIEQVQENYSAMAQHIIRGLGIMQEYRARPSLVAGSNLIAASLSRLPFLDVFIIKLFAAPCKFADPPAITDVNGMRLSVGLISSRQQPAESRDFPMIAPDMRRELTKIAASALEFLDKVSQVRSVGTALQLLSEKAELLESLESWLTGLKTIQTRIGPPGIEPISTSFLRMFYLILKIVLLGALECSPAICTELQSETGRLQGVANELDVKVGAYRAKSEIR